MITLSAVQSGMSSQFSYGWLSACNGGARVSALEEVPLSVVILGNPVTSETVRFEVRGAEGKSLRFSLTTTSGKVVSEQAGGAGQYGRNADAGSGSSASRCTAAASQHANS